VQVAATVDSEFHGEVGRIGAHFPDVADRMAAAGWAVRLAACFKLRVPDDFTPRGDRESVALGVVFLIRGTLVGSICSQSGAHGSSRPTRSAGLGSESTRTSTATKPRCLVTQLNWHCNAGETEPGIHGITGPDLGIGNLRYHLIPSCMTP
jgi:hypothetical protein